MTERPQQLADAFVAVAEANHYMVGLVEKFTADELSEAKQVLINRQNKLIGLSVGAIKRHTYKILDLALDLIEQKEKELL